MEDMDSARGVVLLNSTPAYYFILPFCVGMLRRYMPGLLWDIVLATEEPEHPVCIKLERNYGVKLLRISKSRAGFLESRLAALEGVRETDFCLMLQEDFILEMPARIDDFERLISYMLKNPKVTSARLMPCPGPASKDDDAELSGWKVLSPERDTYGFTFQATLWRTTAAELWFRTLVDTLEELAPRATTDPTARRAIELRDNLAENAQGQALFWATLGKSIHLAWARQGSWPNAVYLSPFPYRPTAIVRGSVEEWAKELARREGFLL